MKRLALRYQRTLPRPKGYVMSSFMFSSFVGIIAVLVTPAVMTVIYAVTEQHTRRRDRLRAWQVTVLATTTGLGAWTYFWVLPYGESLLIAKQPLWLSVIAGIVLSFVLEAIVRHTDHRQRQLEARIIEAVLRP